MKHAHVKRLIAAAIVGCIPIGSAKAAISWTGAAGTDWANGKNWSNNAGPSTTDTALFNDVGSSILPGDVTSIVNADRTVGGLAFTDSAGHYHTLDLGGHTLTITGNLSFNLDQNQNTTTTVRDGTLTLSGPFANLSAGRAASSSSSGIADLSGLTALNATVQSFQVGTSTAGVAIGTLTLSPSNTISAQLISIGASNNSQDTGGTLHLGLNNTISAGEFDIGKNNSGGLVDIVNGGTLNLGTATQRTVLQIANQNTNTNGTYSGVLNLGNATVNLHLDSLVVAEKNGGPGGTSGQFLGGGSGSIAIGDPNARGNAYIAYTVNGGSTQATVDFSRLGTLQAYVGDFAVAKAPTGSASATVSLAASNTIDASNGITIGQSGNATLTLGKTNTFLTPQLTIGQDYSNSKVSIASGGTLNLGSPSQRTSVSIANQNINTNSSYVAKLDLSGATFNAYLGDLIVAQKDGGPGDTHGTLLAGNAGAVDIGDPSLPGNFYVGRSVNGGTATGIVDFSGLHSLTAHLNNLVIGQALSGNAQGTLQLAATNSITANNIIVGQSGNATLTLGHTNTILTPQLTIAQDYSDSTVSLPSGGTLNLGSPTQLTSIFLANGNTNTNSTLGGTLDLGSGTVVAYLDKVVLGTKNMAPGRENGTITISDHADNYVQANSIAIGGNQSDGFLNFGGGTLIANSITAGTGTATFNWTGGRLSVGNFGMPTIPFDLKNTGTGTLAPGSAASPIGVTNIYGNYMQGLPATTAIDIAGDTPGTGNDLVNVSGNANLAGTLSLSAINGFVPSVGQNFLIATYGSRTGTFGFVSPPHLPENAAFQLDYTSNPNQLVVHIVPPVAQKWVGTASAAAFSTPANWDTQMAPGTSSSLTINNSTGAAQTVTVNTSTTVHRIALQGTGGPVDLEVPEGIRLGVANQVVVGPNATLTGGGQVIGDVAVTGGTLHVAGGDVISNSTGTIQLSGAQTNLLAGNVASDGQINVDAGASATISGALTGAGALNIASGGKVQLSRGGGQSSVSSLTIAPAGALDLTNNGLSIHYGANPDPAASIRASLASGYNGGAWNGSGIVTSLADGSHGVGFVDSADGAASGIPANTVLAKYALYGDTNLDGKVGFDDLITLARHYGQTSATWDAGDFNYDGTVSFDDLVLLARDYGQVLTSSQLALLPSSVRADVEAAFADVPEPAQFGVLCLAGFGLLWHRDRHTNVAGRIS